MSSILTNTSAMVALQTMKGINMNLPMSKELKDAIANPNDKGVS